MKVVQINATCGSGSTGKICVSISELLTQRGIENNILYASGYSAYPLGWRYMKPQDVKIQALRSRIFGSYGFNSKAATNKLIGKLEQLQPDIVHLHNLHGHNCDLKILFSYLKAKKTKIFWTFHDCWAFTGYCPYYDLADCDQWKTGCKKCTQRRKYSWFFDNSRDLFEKKKELLTGLDMTIVTPSQWMAEQVEQSFLHKYDIKVINNGIDLSIFYPRESDFREKHGCTEKYIVLGVAFGWGKRKGLDVFIELEKRLDKRYQIVLVGTDEHIDKQLAGNIITVHRTQNQAELAQIYSAADVFVNPTREENYPTVNMEALACGTPVVTFDTGGSSEMLDETCGITVPKDDITALERGIISVCEGGGFLTDKCIKKAAEFDADDRFKEYVQLYELE